MVQGRCMKCKAAREIKNAQVAITRGGKGRSFTGECSTCGTKMFAMISKDTADKAVAGGMKSYVHEAAAKGGAQRSRRKSKSGGCDCDKK